MRIEASRARRSSFSLAAVSRASLCRIALAGALLLPAAGLAAQDAHVPLPADSLEGLLGRAPFSVASFRDNRFAGDRTHRATLVFGDGTRVPVKWARAPRGGGEFNNHPRREVAAYRLQKLFLEEDAYVVPPTVVRCVPLRRARALEPDARPTFGDEPWVLVVLQYWLSDVTEGDVFHEGRVRWDSTYARFAGNLNVFTYLADHADSNRGNVLVGTDPRHPRFFAVDNGLTFGSEPSDRGDDWREMRVDRLPRATVDRLRGITLADLERSLGVVAQFERQNGEWTAVDPTSNLDPGRGVRKADGIWQLGLTTREIRNLHRRLRRLIESVDDGEISLF